MKNLVLIVSCFLFTATAMAKTDRDPRQPVQFSPSEKGLGIVTITGAEAEKIFDALDVEPTREFGFVQSETKTLDKIECIQAILGDTPPEMTGPRYTCQIEINLR